MTGSILVALWLLGAIIGPQVFPSDVTVARLLAFLWIVPAGLALSGKRFAVPLVYRRDGVLALAVGLFIIAILPQAWFGPTPVSSIGYVMVTAVAFWTAAAVWSLFFDDGRAMLAVYSLLGTSVLVLYLILGDWEGRFEATQTANTIGLISISLIAGAFGIRSRMVRFGVISAALTVLLSTQSRASLLGATAMLGVILLWYLRGLRRKAGAIFVLTIIAFILYLNLSSITNQITAILLLDDPYRGLGTGFTGRTVAWKEALDIWRQNRYFGVGYRGHEAVMTTASSAHNGYLALLAEIGLIGVAPLGLLLFRGGRRLLDTALAGDEIARIGVAFWVAYLCVGFFERYLINFGNPASLLALMFLLMPSARRDTRRFQRASSLSRTQQSSRWPTSWNRIAILRGRGT